MTLAVFSAGYLVASGLSSADGAVLLLTGGALLLVLECLRPGLILAGVAGLTLVLVGVHRLVALPLSLPAALLLGLAALLILAGAPSRLWPVGGLLATISLAAGMLRLVTSRPPISPALAIAAAVVLAPLLAALAHIAVLARRGKRPLPGSQPQPG